MTLAMLRRHAAAIVVEHVLRVDQVAMVLQQPIHAVRIAAFLVGGQRHDEVAIGTKPSRLNRISGRP